MKKKKHYIIKRAGSKPLLNSGWDGIEWENANILDIAIFRDESTYHHPDTKIKLLYSDKGIYGQFKVEDQYVRAVHLGYQASVCKDSCVEFFVKPKKTSGYLNFEFNCGGALLCSYLTDCTRIGDGFAEYVMLKDSELDMVEIYHSLPEKIDPEITEKTEWLIGFFIPFSLFEIYVGNIDNLAENRWSANFYKCADETSHPHWASWNPITETNFHSPECFGDIEFDS